MEGQSPDIVSMRAIFIRHKNFFWRPAVWAAIIFLLAACRPPQVTQALIQVELVVDGQTLSLQLPAGSTAQEAIDQAGVSLGKLDRLEPPEYTLLTAGARVRVIRVTEEFSVEQETIPFERQVLQTESLPEQERLLAQSGVNGLREITYRHLYEDGVEVARSPVKSVVVAEPIPEIMMVGIQTPFVPVAIPGRIIYLLGGNVWMMAGSTADRLPLITTGDLDGRVFTLSDSGKWLLFTRRSEEEEQINTLWAANLGAEPVELYDLQVENVVHFAAWAPGRDNQVVFSTPAVCMAGGAPILSGVRMETTWHLYVRMQLGWWILRPARSCHFMI